MGDFSIRVNTCIILGVGSECQFGFSASFRAQELCESRGGRPGLPVPNSPYSLCGRKATLT